MKMNQSAPPMLKPGEQLWGIYFTDQEYAPATGDPLCAVVAAPAKIIADKATGRLGLNDAWVHPLTIEQINQSGTLQHSPRNIPV